MTSLAVDPTNASVVYAGAAGGGVWKSINGGTTWAPLTDSQASLAIGALGISANGQVIYAGTGEDNGSDSQYGQGILVSTNGGSSWTLTGQSVFAGRHIGSIAVDRSNSSHALAATDVGLYTTNNAGTTWTQNTQILTQITAIGPATGGIFQVVQAPDNSLQFWATAGDRCQTEFGDVLVSGDGGSTWSQSLDVFLASGGTAAASRIALGVGSGGTVYAALSDCNGNGLALLKLSSSVWANIGLGLGLDYFNVSGAKTGQGDYDNVVAVDPTSNNHVVFGGVTIVASSDGGSTYTDIGNVYGEAAAPGGFIHPDFHAIAFTAANSFYVGNDGGVWKTTDLGGSGQSSDWVNLNATLNTVQFFRGISPDLTHLLGGAQDNGSAGNLPGSAPLPGWQGYHGGDGGFTAVNASGGATTLYAEYPHLGIERGSWTLDSSDQYSPYDSFQAAAPCISGSGPACGDPSGFTAPFRMDPTNPQRLIAGTNKVYQSTSGGAPGSWTAISSDLTTGTTVFASGDFLSAITMGQKAGQTGIIFTGSFEVGFHLYKNFARRFPKPVIVEMGGKNPAIVSRKADLDEAAEGIMRSAFGFSGQKCSANSRVYVERPVLADFTRRLVEKTEAITIGDPVERQNWLGPVVNQRAVDRYGQAVSEARQDGREPIQREEDRAEQSGAPDLAEAQKGPEGNRDQGRDERRTPRHEEGEERDADDISRHVSGTPAGRRG